MYRRSRKTYSLSDKINICFEKLNKTLNANQYTKKYVSDIFNSKDVCKINDLIKTFFENLSNDDFNLLVYQNKDVDLNFVDNKFFKVECLNLIDKKIKSFNTKKLLDIFNKFIILNEKELKIYFKIKNLNTYHKGSIINEPIILDYLIGLDIIDKPKDYKGSDYIPATLKKCLDNTNINEDIKFIENTLNKINDGTFKCTSKFIIKLNKILDAKTEKLFIKEQQICKIIMHCKKKYLNDYTFIDRLNYHGFLYAMNLMKEKYNINCFLNYSFGINKKIIKEDNGKIFEYYLKNNIINLKKLNEYFIFNILENNKTNIINVIAKYKCNFTEQITNLLTEKMHSWRFRRNTIFKKRDKEKVRTMIKVCEHMGYNINNDVFMHIFKFYSDEEILKNIDKRKIEIKQIMCDLIKNKCWNVIKNILADEKYNYSLTNYLSDLNENLKNIKKKVQLFDYLEIYNYNLIRYKLNPTKSLKKEALNALNINMIKKLVEKYGMVYTLEDVENYLINRNNFRKYGWTYLNRKQKMYNVAVIVNYLSNKFENIKKIYENNAFYKYISNIYRISQELYLYMFKNNQISINKKLRLKDIILNINDETIEYIIDKYNMNLKNIIIKEKIFNEDILKILLKKNIGTLPEETILFEYLCGNISQNFMILLIKNNHFKINSKIITFMILALIEETYFIGKIIFDIFVKYPFINYKTFEYIENYYHTNLENMPSKKNYLRVKFYRLNRYLATIISMKNNLIIVNENNSCYKMLIFDIDENNLDISQQQFKNYEDKISEINYQETYVIDNNFNLIFDKKINNEKFIKSKKWENNDIIVHHDNMIENHSSDNDSNKSSLDSDNEFEENYNSEDFDNNEGINELEIINEPEGINELEGINDDLKNVIPLKKERKNNKIIIV